MTYRVYNNSGPKDAIYQFAMMDAALQELAHAAHAAIWLYVTSNRPPYALTGLLVGDGIIFDDPSPGPEYAGSLDGAWIWSSPTVYFRIRLIWTKSKLDLWEHGAKSKPDGLTLLPTVPTGRLNVARI